MAFCIGVAGAKLIAVCTILRPRESRECVCIHANVIGYLSRNAHGGRYQPYFMKLTVWLFLFLCKYLILLSQLSQADLMMI